MIPTAFVINLDERPDRLNKLVENFKDIQINIVRIPAIKNKIGAIGCGMSHIKALEKAKTDNLESCIIFEDDFSFFDFDKKIINKTINEIVNVNNYNVCLLAGVYNKKIPTEYKINNFTINKLVDAQTAVAYIVRKNYYDILISNFKEAVYNIMLNQNNLYDNILDIYSIDQYWKKLQNDNWICIHPCLGYQREDYSNILNKNVNYKNLYLR
jgi:GR25 family glycosyltransferase involved in LPS biosynthesis